MGQGRARLSSQLGKGHSRRDRDQLKMSQETAGLLSMSRHDPSNGAHPSQAWEAKKSTLRAVICTVGQCPPPPLAF